MFTIVLYQPEKPSNVGNIIRTCSATLSNLIIIGPLSFPFDDKSLKRAGMDYIDMTKIKIFDSYQDFLKEYRDENIYYVTRYSKNIYSEADFKNKGFNYFLMFGRESHGIPKEILKENMEKTLRIPMSSSSRSLNLSNSVAIVLYEGLRQQEFYDLATREVIKGEDFLES